MTEQEKTKHRTHVCPECGGVIEGWSDMAERHRHERVQSLTQGIKELGVENVNFVTGVPIRELEEIQTP